MTHENRPAGFLRRWRNTLYSGADHLWLLLLWAISTPVFVGILGLDTFGVWVLVNTVIGMGGVVSLGFGEATIRYVAKYRGLGQPADIRRIVDTTMALYAVVGVITALGLYFAAPWLAAVTFKLSGDAAADAVLALRLAGVALLVTAYLKTYEAIINGFERFDLTARAGMLVRSFIILGNVALAFAGFGLVALIACALLGLAAQTVIYFIICRRCFVPQLRVFGIPDRATLTEIAGFGLQTWLQICAGALNSLADRFLVGALLDPAAAGIYAICLQLAQQIHLLLTRGLAFLMPQTSRTTAGSSDHRKAVLRSYWSASILTLVVSGAIALPLFALAPQILAVWVGPEFARQGAESLRWMAIYFAAFGGFVPAFYLLNGAGRPMWNTVTTLGSGLVGLTLAAHWLPAMGIQGAIAAKLVALPLYLLILWALHRHVLHRDGWTISLMLILWPAGLAVIAQTVTRQATMTVAATASGVLLWGVFLGVVGALLGLAPYLLFRRDKAAISGKRP